ncbi:MAG: crossover junction endodeoxyribonuclease RuvC [Sphingomonadales bacterium]|nr:crossover junction endodeoxyribonuclease RuvC [Sphingomonadales bacterium]
MAVILGLDPGLASTGWGVIRSEGNRLSHIANGQIKTDAKMPLASRLLQLDLELKDIIIQYAPDAVAVEEVFVNKNPQSTLKLGQARGVVLLGASRGGVPVSEYATRLVKKAVVGVGNAQKEQVQAMLAILLPGVKLSGHDAADALAVAITHAHWAGRG